MDGKVSKSSLQRCQAGHPSREADHEVQPGRLQVSVQGDRASGQQLAGSGHEAESQASGKYLSRTENSPKNKHRGKDTGTGKAQ